jgi:sterol desaturase/sphingolipid hydroxylase (fatty acid hydroxylase superfamily)
MMEYVNIVQDSFSGYWNYLGNEILHPTGRSYFYWLIGISLFFFLLELIVPWRKKQPKIRDDFWLDGFYMFFNFFIFSLIGFNALSNLFVEIFNDLFNFIGLSNPISAKVQSLPVWLSIVLIFVMKDLMDYFIHRLLHKNDFLWEFHKVHHSVKQMGFAAHLRYHWMENIIYKSIEYIPLSMLGFGLLDYFAANIVAISIGHFNHSNLNIPLGPFKYVLNNPQMHIWHHAKELPKNPEKGVNFGLSLSIWDYIFKTNYIPTDGRDVELGFENDENFPKTFLQQELILNTKLKPQKQNVIDQKGNN